MPFNLSTLQRSAISAVGAVFAATLFITAVVGPLGQIA
jgi:hypothetical protein